MQPTWVVLVGEAITTELQNTKKTAIKSDDKRQHEICQLELPSTSADVDPPVADPWAVASLRLEQDWIGRRSVVAECTNICLSTKR